MANQEQQNSTDPTLQENSEVVLVDTEEGSLKVACDTSRRTHQGMMEIRGEPTTLYQTNRGSVSAEGSFDLVAAFVRDAGLVKALRIDALSSTNKLTGEKTYFIDTIASSVGTGSIGDFPLRFSLSLSQIVPRDEDNSSDELVADMSANADDWEENAPPADEE